MTEKELSQCHYLNLEMARLKKELKELEGMEYGQVDYSGMPKGSGTSDRTGNFAMQREEIRELIMLKSKQCMIERVRIERFINTIEDSEMRLIIRLRCINFLGWAEIAAETMVLDEQGNIIKEQDRTTVAKKYNKFIKNYNIPTFPIGGQ